MVVAGIDEAGYGPLLGPLVVGCCAFEVQDPPVGSSLAADPAGDLDEDDSDAGANDKPSSDRSNPLPCLWKRLRKHVSRNRLRSGRKLHINDSKAVYSPASGLRELERSVLALAAASFQMPGDLNEFLSLAAGDALREMAEYPWYRPRPDETFPLQQEGMPLRLFANSLRQDMLRTQTRCIHLHARVVFERQFNRMLEGTRNKGSALFSISAVHLDHLLRTYGHQDLAIVCDRQGGRERYGALLRLMFEDWSLEILRESEGHSEYRLHQQGHVVRLTFREKAEADCLPVAVASMLSKYLREALMARFNRFWNDLLPDLTPTAGYYSDGTRFLGDIDAKRKELGITDELLVRCK